MKKNRQIWHGLRVEAVLKQLRTTKHGISEKEAKERLYKFGLNKAGFIILN